MAEQTKQFPQKPDHRDGWTRRLVAGFLTLASLTTCSAAVAAGQHHISSAAVQSADVSSDKRQIAETPHAMSAVFSTGLPRRDR